MTDNPVDFASLPEVDSISRAPQQRRPRFDGDVSAMPDRACWALQHLLTRRYVSSEADPDIYSWILEYRADLSVRLSELDLQLRISDGVDIAFIEQARYESAKGIKLLRREPLGTYDSILALHLAQREKFAALWRVSILDPLTGLFSGRYLDAALWPARVRGSAPLAALYVDLDGLKRRNDCFGHAAGDRLIARAANVLRTSVRRGSDDVARLNTAGDEFLIVLTCPSLERAERIAATLLERLGAVSISASIGVAFTASAEHGPRAALREHSHRLQSEA